MSFRSVDTPRSVLFVPGSDPARVASAADSAADLVVLDLEHADDSFGDGAVGRRVMKTLADCAEDSPSFGVRVHGLDTTRGAVDLDAIRSASDQPQFVVLPDVSGPEELKLAEERIDDTDIDIFALIEAPAGVFEARAIATAAPRVKAVAFGPGDFASSMGIPDDVDPDFSVPRYLVSMAANSASLSAVDMPNISDAENDTVTKRETVQARSMGYDAKVAVTESQVRIINDVFDGT
jgi:citrate lyase beta subunit